MDLINKAQARLVLEHPFFAGITLRRPVTRTDGIPTAAMDGMGQMQINPEFVTGKPVGEVVFLLAHGAMHYMLNHCARRGARPVRDWNIAADAVINETLIASGVGEFIEGGVRYPGAETMSTEEVYSAMQEDGTFDQVGAAGGIGEDIQQEGEHYPPPAEMAEREAQIRVEVAQAAKAAEMQGKLPEHLRRLVDSIIKVRTKWYDILERHMTGYRRDDMTWSRPNRRCVAAGVYLPGISRVPEMGEVVIAVDTSGSVSAEMLAQFAGHITRILEDCRPSAVHVVYCDAEVQHADTYQPEDDVKLEMHGGGGTAFKPVFDWVQERGVSPDVLVYLTDLCGSTDFPPPEYAVVWLTTRHTTAAFGEVVEYAP